MKTWLGRFLGGVWIACQILIAVGIAAIVFRGLITALLWVVAWVERTAPTPSTIVTVICICFVVVFGIIWSFWD